MPAIMCGDYCALKIVGRHFNLIESGDHFLLLRQRAVDVHGNVDREGIATDA